MNLKNINNIKDLIKINNNQILNKKTNIKIDVDEIGMCFFETYINNSEQKCIEILVENFDINKEIIKKDLKEFLETLYKETLFEIGTLPIDNFMILEPTNMCDGGCIHCFHKFKERYYWNEEEISKNIYFLKKHNIKYVSITGGEIFSPHYKKNAFKLIRELRNNDIKIISISTNGMFLDKNDLKLLESYNDERFSLRISIDSLNENIFEIRPGYVGKNIPKSLEIINRYNFNIVVTTILSTQKIEDIKSIIDNIKNIPNIKVWNIRPMIHTENKKIDRNFDEILEIYEYILKNQTELEHVNIKLADIISTEYIKSCNKLSLKRDFIHPCKNEVNHRTLKANNTVTRCPILPEISEINVITKSENLYNQKKLLDDLKVSNMICSKCKFIELCCGGCRLNSISYGCGINGCDINAKKTLEWILNDKNNVIKEILPNFYEIFMEVVVSV